MKTAEIEQILINRGYENGVKYILMAQNEEVRTLRKSVTELGQLLNQMVDTMQNVVNGVHGMREEQMKAMKKAGLLLDTAEPDLGASTHAIGSED